MYESCAAAVEIQHFVTHSTYAFRMMLTIHIGLPYRTLTDYFI
jgi:hypothetical protein